MVRPHRSNRPPPSQLNLQNDNMSEPDMLGRAYEYLIKRFANDAGKKGGEFYTPKEVVRLIVRLLDPQEKMQIWDPTCGSGGMLIESARYIPNRKGVASLSWVLGGIAVGLVGVAHLPAALANDPISRSAYNDLASGPIPFSLR